ncbi:hypothetical protein OAK19_05845 [Aureispira]|nr:hypothetical protein [Aureispira sp.]
MGVFFRVQFWGLLWFSFFTILIPLVVVAGWRRKLIRYQDGEIEGKELLSNFWSSRMVFVAIVIFIGISILKGINYNDLLPTISIAKALIFFITILFILLQLVYAVITGLLIKKINESQKTE